MHQALSNHKDWCSDRSLSAALSEVRTRGAVGRAMILLVVGVFA
jgi:hypothetical protein